MAAFASSVRRVEGEDTRLELGDGGPAVEAGEALAEGQAVDHALRELTGSLCPLDAADVLAFRATLRLTGASLREDIHLDDTTGQGSGRLHRLREPSPQVALHHQTVDDHGDVVVELLVEPDLLVQPADLVVHADARVALQPELLEQLFELALAASHHRCHHHEPRALVQGHDAVGDLLDRLPLNRQTALRAVGLADPRPEQAAGSRRPRSQCRPSSVGCAEVVFWSIEIAGENPSIESTSGFSIRPRNWRAYAERDST